MLRQIFSVSYPVKSEVLRKFSRKPSNRLTELKRELLSALEDK